MVRKAVIVLALVGLAGCNRATEECEDLIKMRLRSPATYERATANEYRVTDDGPAHISTFIEYDAANAYGTPIRGIEQCITPIGDDGPEYDRTRIARAELFDRLR